MWPSICFSVKERDKPESASGYWLGLRHQGMFLQFRKSSTLSSVVPSECGNDVIVPSLLRGRLFCMAYCTFGFEVAVSIHFLPFPVPAVQGVCEGAVLLATLLLVPHQ